MLSRALLRLRSSGIFEIRESPAKSPGARGRTHGESPESSRWPERRLDLRACALFARHNRAERSGCDCRAAVRFP
jgi:hypothetical protein